MSPSLLIDGEARVYYMQAVRCLENRVSGWDILSQPKGCTSKPPCSCPSLPPHLRGRCRAHLLAGPGGREHMFLRGRTEGPESRGERSGMELLILRMKIQGLDNEGTGKAFFFFLQKHWCRVSTQQERTLWFTRSVKGVVVSNGRSGVLAILKAVLWWGGWETLTCSICLFLWH